MSPAAAQPTAVDASAGEGTFVTFPGSPFELYQPVPTGR
jgi:hypothetical protein